MADVGACRTVLPCSPNTVNAGTHNTVDASKARGGALPYLSGMGVDGAHNTVGKMSARTTLLAFCHVREVVGYCPVGVHGMVLSIAVDLGALPYFLRLFPGPYRADVPGRLVPVDRFRLRQSEKSCKQRFGASLVGVGSGRCSSLARPSDRRLVRPFVQLLGF